MPHGAPDWSNVAKEVSVFRLDDMAELAVRLGSPVIWDRRGDVFHIQDFSHGVGSWQVSTVGVGSDVTLSARLANVGGYCGLMETATGGGGTVYYKRAFPIPASSRIGFEVHFKPVQNFDQLRMWIDWYTGSIHKQAYIKFDNSDDAIFYKDSNGVITEIATGLSWEGQTSYYHFIKYAMDFESDEFLWLRYDDRTVSMEDIAVFQENSGTAPEMYVYLQLMDDGVGQGQLRIDPIILTQDEP